MKEMNLSEKTQEDALKFFERARKKNLIKNRRGNVVAASIIYISALFNYEQKSQRQMEDATGMSPAGLRGFYKLLIKKLYTKKQWTK